MLIIYNYNDNEEKLTRCVILTYLYFIQILKGKEEFTDEIFYDLNN